MLLDVFRFTSPASVDVLLRLTLSRSRFSISTSLSIGCGLDRPVICNSKGGAATVDSSAQFEDRRDRIAELLRAALDRDFADGLGGGHLRHSPRHGHRTRIRRAGAFRDGQRAAERAAGGGG